MQEAGVPVTYGYISDAHDRYPGGSAFGPGEAGYVAQLKAYDQAFDGFFQRLAKDGITPANSLFVVTSDENDHFVGGKPSPADCDGVTTPCSYRQIGEITANVHGLLATQQHLTTPFQLKSESAPSFYLDGDPAPDTATTREFERAVSKLTAVNPITGTTEPSSHQLADRTEMKILHMVTGDPLRTATFTDFLDPNYLAVAGAANCATPCVGLNAEEAWNHGDFAPDINTTWLGLAGPGVKRLGATGTVWSHDTDIRPTMLALLGLHDVYAHDGRALTEFLTPCALPKGLHAADQDDNRRLATAYKQLNGGVGEFASATLSGATRATASDTPGYTAYRDTGARLAALGDQRDRLARRIGILLDDAASGTGRIPPATARDLARQAEDLIHQADRLARGGPHHAAVGGTSPPTAAASPPAARPARSRAVPPILSPLPETAPMPRTPAGRAALAATGLCGLLASSCAAAPAPDNSPTALRARLPQSIRTSGELRIGSHLTYVPYVMVAAPPMPPGKAPAPVSTSEQRTTSDAR
ncbi:hypothetical protein ACH4E7_43930 [Kitasatospora sp. NPDC018058]|uniref:hypothetical protein n=1 Tax=Kitasatospora sp. NPDC018058 TaxID=3364025 RepID=UPI0037BFD821